MKHKEKSRKPPDPEKCRAVLEPWEQALTGGTESVFHFLFRLDSSRPSQRRKAVSKALMTQPGRVTGNKAEKRVSGSGFGSGGADPPSSASPFPTEPPQNRLDISK